MKTLLELIFTIGLFTSINAQSLRGELTINGKSKTELKLETNSAVQLFKEFKTGKYQLKFDLESKEMPKNIYKETIVFFEFITKIKKDGKLVKNLQRKQPIPYFPGDMNLPAEAFDFIGALADLEDEESADEMIGVMQEGKYSVQLVLKPIGFKGEITPVEFSFVLGEI